MEKEIKEILEYLAFTNEDMMWCDKITLNTKQSQLLLDYITNLQEEKDSLDDYNRHLHNELKDYKSRIDKAIEYLGIDEEMLETCKMYDVNGIEVYKILQGNKWNEVERAYLDDKPIGSDK